MINYETNNSPFFIANKNYCEAIEKQLHAFKCEYAGFCNSYGYEIVTSFKKDNLAYSLKFVKHQTTRDGILIPVDAGDYAGIELTVEGFEKLNRIDFGRNKIRRFFSRSSRWVPSPFYFKTNFRNEKAADIVLLFLANQIDSFKLKNGKAQLIIHSASTAVFDLIPELEKTLCLEH